MSIERQQKRARIINFAVILFFAIFTFVMITFKPFSFVIIKGESMSPSLHDGDVIFFSKHQEGKLQKGDLVIAPFPENWNGYVPNTQIIKRAVALPGDIIDINNDYLRVNGENTIDITGITSSYPFGFANSNPYMIPPGKVFVAGDNVGNSLDSLYLFLQGDSEFLVDESTVAFSKHNK